jgi:hypothetical protein
MRFKKRLWLVFQFHKLMVTKSFTYQQSNCDKMMRFIQTLAIITVAVTFLLTYSDANLRATAVEQDFDKVDVVESVEVRRLPYATEDDDYAKDNDSMGMMGKGEEKCIFFITK